MKKRPTRWTELMDEYLFKKARAGEPFHVIASGLGVSRAAAWSHYVAACEQRGISPYRIKRRAHSDETRAKVIAMRMRGISSLEIARATGLRLNQVTGIWNTWRDRDQYRSQVA